MRRTQQQQQGLNTPTPWDSRTSCPFFSSQVVLIWCLCGLICSCLAIREAEAAAVKARSTAATRVAVVAGALRTRAFMERYAGDVASREARLEHIRARWCVDHCRHGDRATGWLVVVHTVTHREQQQGLVKDTKALEAFELKQLVRCVAGSAPLGSAHAAVHHPQL